MIDQVRMHKLWRFCCLAQQVAELPLLTSTIVHHRQSWGSNDSSHLALCSEQHRVHLTSSEIHSTIQPQESILNCISFKTLRRQILLPQTLHSLLQLLIKRYKPLRRLRTRRPHRLQQTHYRSMPLLLVHKRRASRCRLAGLEPEGVVSIQQTPKTAAPLEEGGIVLLDCELGEQEPSGS